MVEGLGPAVLQTDPCTLLSMVMVAPYIFKLSLFRVQGDELLRGTLPKGSEAPIQSILAMALGILISLVVEAPLILGVKCTFALIFPSGLTLAFLLTGMREAEKLLRGYRSLGR